MAFALVQDFSQEAGDNTSTNYDAIHRMIIGKVTEPTGLIIHTAGFTGEGFRIFEVWESREQCERFMNEVVMPTVMDVTKGTATPPKTTSYELHNLLLP